MGRSSLEIWGGGGVIAHSVIKYHPDSAATQTSPKTTCRCPQRLVNVVFHLGFERQSNAEGIETLIDELVDRRTCLLQPVVCVLL